jgi:hypothetical protein
MPQCVGCPADLNEGTCSGPQKKPVTEKLERPAAKRAEPLPGTLRESRHRMNRIPAKPVNADDYSEANVGNLAQYRPLPCFETAVRISVRVIDPLAF